MRLRRCAVSLALSLAPIACTLHGIADGIRPDTSDGGAGDASSREDVDAGGAASEGGGEACPGCEIIVTGEDHPTELVRFEAGRIAWIRQAAAGAVVSADFEGKRLVYQPDHPVAFAHDLVPTDREVFVISQANVILRYLTYSTCNSVPGGLRLLASFGAEILSVRDGGLSRGHCGANNLVTSDSVTAIDGDVPNAWYGRANGDVVRCDASGDQCEATRAILASGQGSVQRIVHDSAQIFWVAPAPAPEGTLVEIRARAKSAAGTSGAPVVIAKAKQPKALVSTGADLYWTDLDEGTVMRAPTSGGTPVVIARDLAQPWGLAVNETHVFVAESGRGRIVRLPR